MKIVLVNYRFFVSGGPERYYFNIKEVLEKNGNEVIPFSIKNSRNLPAGKYEKYFLDAVDDEVYFSHSNKHNIRVLLKSFSRMFYSFEAKRKMGRLLDETKPDLVYIMQFHNKISPSIIDAAKNRNIPVVHRISDFQYMCPNALFYNEKYGVCEDCLKGKKWNCVKHKCVLNSAIYSFIKMSAKWLHDIMGIASRVDSFVVPSTFTITKMLEYGITSDRLAHIPTFFNFHNSQMQIEYQPFALYVGRIEKQKGIFTLVKAFENTHFELKIIGFSNDGYEEKIKQYLGKPSQVLEGDYGYMNYGKNGNIQFLGRKNFDEIIPYLKTCLFTVVPSEWYDNFPNVILESFAYKKAVVATNIGSLPELVRDGETGLLFNYADPADLSDKITKLMNHPENARIMGSIAFDEISKYYSPETHYNALMHLFECLLKAKKTKNK